MGARKGGMLVRTSPSSGSRRDLGRMVGGAYRWVFFIENDSAASRLRGRWASGGVWCPLVPGTQKRPGRAAASAATAAPGAERTTRGRRPLRPLCPAGTGLRGTRRGAEAPGEADSGGELGDRTWQLVKQVARVGKAAETRRADVL